MTLIQISHRMYLQINAKEPTQGITMLHFHPTQTTANLINSLYAASLLMNASMFLPQTYKVYKNKSGGELSLLMFLGFGIGQIFAILNGYYFNDPFIFYGFIFTFFTCGSVSISILYYKHFKQRTYWLIGFSAAAILATISIGLKNSEFRLIASNLYTTFLFCGASLYLVQAFKIYKAKCSKHVSLLMLTSFVICQSLAVLNGLIFNDIYIVIGYIPAIICSAVALIVALHFKATSHNAALELKTTEQLQN